MIYTNIDWNICKSNTNKLQRKITEAYKQNDYVKVAKLQDILIDSFHARALAVKYILENPGKTTPGVDGII